MSQLTSADGEQMETQHWLESAVDFGYLSREQVGPLLQTCEEIGRMLGGIILKAGSFCKPEALSIRDEQGLYFASTGSAESESLKTDH